MYLVPTELAGDMESVLAVRDAARSNSKVIRAFQLLKQYYLRNLVRY